MSTPFEVCHEAILKLLDKTQKNRRRFKSAFPITWLIRKEAHREQRGQLKISRVCQAERRQSCFWLRKGGVGRFYSITLFVLTKRTCPRAFRFSSLLT